MVQEQNADVHESLGGTSHLLVEGGLERLDLGIELQRLSDACLPPVQKLIHSLPQLNDRRDRSAARCLDVGNAVSLPG